MIDNENTTDAPDDDGPVIRRRPVRDTGDLDITPMIDITFLLLIFFLVCSTLGRQTAVNLPPARHGTGVSEQRSTVITVAEADGPPAGPGRPASPLVYLADGIVPPALSADPEVQQQQIVDHVKRGHADGKTTVLIKAGRGVLHREVARVAGAVGAAGLEKIELHVAVFEIE